MDKDQGATEVAGNTAKATVINTGKVGVENTVRAAYHICHHNEVPPTPCETEVEI